MAVRTPLILPGGMKCKRRDTFLQALAIVAGACSSFLLAACFRPLREMVRLPVVVGAEASSRLPPTPRFHDTVVVALGESAAMSQRAEHTPLLLSVSAALDSAVRGCQEGERQHSIRTMLTIVEYYSERDSLHWEALFQLGECFAVGGEYRRAMLLLGELAYRDRDVPPDVHQRAIVRLGHVFCKLGDPGRAEHLFAKLFRLYPASIYRPLASCRVIR